MAMSSTRINRLKFVLKYVKKKMYFELWYWIIQKFEFKVIFSNDFKALKSKKYESFYLICYNCFDINKTIHILFGLNALNLDINWNFCRIYPFVNTLINFCPVITRMLWGNPDIKGIATMFDTISFNIEWRESPIPANRQWILLWGFAQTGPHHPVRLQQT